MATKNLGQVSGVHIGSTPPSNTILIWYDSTPSQLRHKVYNPTLKQWVVLDQNIISAITYSELTNMAKNSGLSVGEYFQITDRSNALALAITSTKVQYCDALGNILIDDLGTNIQYHVTSSNLQIDDVVGVFDETNRKLVFQFNEQTPDFTADDYVLGKVRRNNIWSLAKYKLSSFLSKVTGNSITWNGGFFFSFSDALKNVLDKAGGVVSKTTYDRDKEQLTTSINNVGKENQNIIQNAHNELTEATKPDSLYGTKLPSISTGGEATDIAKGDTLLNIVSKIQRYINRFKFASGVRIDQDFADAASAQYVNNNDTVKSAFQKIQYWIKKQKTGNNISVSSEDYVLPESSPTSITKDDDLATALSKLEYWVKHITAEQLLNNIIGFDKLQASGVLPTDIFRLDLTTSFDFSGCGFGGVVVQGVSNNFFSRDGGYPYNPYRIKLYYNPAFPKILGFVPVIPVIPNNTNQYSNACSFVHYDEDDGATLQFIIQLSEDKYDELYEAGSRYLQCLIQADIYGSKSNQKTVYIDMNYINIININVPGASLQHGSKQHIVFSASITPTETNS